MRLFKYKKYFNSFISLSLQGYLKVDVHMFCVGLAEKYCKIKFKYLGLFVF